MLTFSPDSRSVPGLIEPNFLTKLDSEDVADLGSSRRKVYIFRISDLGQIQKINVFSHRRYLISDIAGI